MRDVIARVFSYPSGTDNSYRQVVYEIQLEGSQDPFVEAETNGES